jgi:ferredoxin
LNSAPFIVVLLLLFAGPTASTIHAEQRFPPPEFESGYTLPITQTPAARSWAMQNLDALVLIGALLAASHIVHRTRSRRGVLVLSLFSLAYFGFYRQGCICAIGAPQNVALALFDSNYALPIAAAVFFFAPLITSLLAGRTFCAAVCPHGAIQDLVLLRPTRVPAWIEQSLGLLPFIFLGAGLAFAATGTAFVVCRYDPFVPLFRFNGSFPMIATGIGLLIVGMFIGRPFCRFLCPYGALLRIAALVSKLQVRITPDLCTQCRLCENSCPYGAIREPTPPPTQPATLATDRRRLTLALALLPILIAAGALIGSKLATPLSRLHPTVQLAERFVQTGTPTTPPNPPTPDSLALSRAERDPQTLLTHAVALRHRFATAAIAFGAWVGLVIGLKFIVVSYRTPSTDFEPDRGACLACARCFLSCPSERLRCGLPVPSVPALNPGSAPATPNPTPAPATNLAATPPPAHA